MTKWLTIACIIHCAALPIAGLYFAAIAGIHDSPAAKMVEIALVGFAILNSLRTAWKLHVLGNRRMAVAGAIFSGLTGVALLTGSHVLLACALLPLAGFQFQAHRQRHCHQQTRKVLT